MAKNKSVNYHAASAFIGGIGLGLLFGGFPDYYMFRVVVGLLFIVIGIIGSLQYSRNKK